MWSLNYITVSRVLILILFHFKNAIFPKKFISTVLIWIIKTNKRTMIDFILKYFLTLDKDNLSIMVQIWPRHRRIYLDTKKWKVFILIYPKHFCIVKVMLNLHHGKLYLRFIVGFLWNEENSNNFCPFLLSLLYTFYKRTLQNTVHN